MSGRVIATVVTLVLSACGMGGPGPEVLTLEALDTAKPVRSEPSGQPILLTPPEGKDPEGSASAARGMQRWIGPLLDLQVDSTSDAPLINVTVAPAGDDTPHTSERAAEGFRYEDVNGSRALVGEMAGMRFAQWVADGLTFGTQSTGAEEPMLEVARALRAHGDDPRDVRLQRVPEGYEVTDRSEIDRGRMVMAGTMYQRGEGTDIGMTMVSTAFSEDLGPKEMGSFGQDTPSGAHRVDIRGGDGLAFSFTTEVGDFKMRFATVMWLEAPDVLGMVFGVGSAADEGALVELANRLQRTSTEEWDRRYRQDEGPFQSFGEDA